MQLGVHNVMKWHKWLSRRYRRVTLDDVLMVVLLAFSMVLLTLYGVGFKNVFSKHS